MILPLEHLQNMLSATRRCQSKDDLQKFVERCVLGCDEALRFFNDVLLFSGEKVEMLAEMTKMDELWINMSRS
jgi:hypothetical protein